MSSQGENHRIVGCIPCGGKGLRLSLPFSKELLPQKNVPFYTPIIHHSIKKMEDAGAEKIYFIHGKDFKEDICRYYNNVNYIHLRQQQPSFAGSLQDFYSFTERQYSKDDMVLFGLPDTTFEDNPFLSMVKMKGIVCGLFQTSDNSKVDRLNLDHTKFFIKTAKNEENLNFFWGVLKFDFGNLLKMVEDRVFEKTDEIGYILNQYNRQYVYAGDYLDLGTFENLNKYWKE